MTPRQFHDLLLTVHPLIKRLVILAGGKLAVYNLINQVVILKNHLGFRLLTPNIHKTHDAIWTVLHSKYMYHKAPDSHV